MQTCALIYFNTLSVLTFGHSLHTVSTTPSSSHSSSAPAQSSPHGSQLSMNFSNLGPSYRLQFFTSCSTRWNTSEKAPPVWVLPRVTSQQTCFSIDFSPCRSAGLFLSCSQFISSTSCCSAVFSLF